MSKASPPSVWIVGASARAAAFSALRGGFAPQTADLFADVDLAAVCPAAVVRDYPKGLAAIADDLPAIPWMYTGALENSPDLVDAISARRPLWGNAGGVLRQVRDPLLIAGVLRGAGLPACAVAASSDGVPLDGSWLQKPRRSAGGTRIEPWCGSSIPQRGASEVYYQRRVEGLACSAVYVAAGGEAVLLGVTEQLVGVSWLHAGAFQYAGSLGPLALDAEQLRAWQAIGRVLAARFPLMGLFGVDAIVNAEGVWPVEINPRFTASTEILERAGGFSAMAIHAAACNTSPTRKRGEPSTTLCPEFPSLARRASANAWHSKSSRHSPSAVRRYSRQLGPSADGTRSVPATLDAWHGKVVLYAAEDSLVTPDLVREALAASADPLAPDVADIPRVDSRLPAGAPVLTCLASGDSRDEVLARLRKKAASLESLLHRVPKLHPPARI